jgi:rhodanese-related sulfurtransferase
MAGMPEYRMVDLEEVKKAYNAHSALFIDARSFEKYRQGTIMRALNVPVKRFKRMKKWLPARKDAAILIFCNGIECGKSTQLAKRLHQAGYTHLLVYREGFPEWKRRKLPIMAAPKPCRNTGATYHPTHPLQIEGVFLYRDAEDPARIDARWIAPLVERGKAPEGLQLVDVRPSAQYEAGHLPGAINVPFDPKGGRIETGQFPRKGPILLTCRHGSLSTDAWFSLPETLQRRTLILDATVECEGDHCRVTPH